MRAGPSGLPLFEKEHYEAGNIDRTDKFIASVTI